MGYRNRTVSEYLRVGRIAAPVQLPYAQVQDYTGEPVEGDDVVEFRLLYIGRVLGASRSDTRAGLKHQIRRQFHPQIRRLWATNANLRKFVRHVGYDDAMGRFMDTTKKTLDDQERDALVKLNTSLDNLRKYDTEREELQESYRSNPDMYLPRGMEILLSDWHRNGFRFLPLVTDEFSVRCSLDILFLRPEDAGMLVQSGDIDARVKTVFDALRMPKNLSETGGIGPQQDEDPFYCLLEDDKLISEIRVTTDQLLLLPNESEVRANDAVLVINVKLKPVRQHYYDWVFA